MAGPKGSKYYDIFLDYTIQLNHKEKGNILDRYYFELLQAIRDTGSLKAAEMEISYRKVWGSIEDMEDKLGFKLVERHRGGVQGGTTTLTEDGIKLLDARDELRKEFDLAIHSITKKFFRSINN